MIWRHNDVIEKCDLQTDFVSDWPQYAESRITFATTKCVRFFVVIWNTGVSSDQLYVCPDFVWLKFCVVQNPEMVQPGVESIQRAVLLDTSFWCILFRFGLYPGSSWYHWHHLWFFYSLSFLLWVPPRYEAIESKEIQFPVTDYEMSVNASPAFKFVRGKKELQESLLAVLMQRKLNLLVYSQ